MKAAFNLTLTHVINDFVVDALFLANRHTPAKHDSNGGHFGQSVQIGAFFFFFVVLVVSNYMYVYMGASIIIIHIEWNVLAGVVCVLAQAPDMHFASTPIHKQSVFVSRPTNFTNRLKSDQ